MKRLFALLPIMMLLFTFYPAAARSQPPVFETVVRKVFGTNRVVFTHKSEEKLKNNQRIYLYSGEKFVGSGRICSIYTDEHYTCEVPEEIYESISPGDTVSSLPPEKYRVELKKIRENLKRAKAAISPPSPVEAGNEEKATHVAPPKRAAPGGMHTLKNMITEGNELVARGDSISLQAAEEKYLTALKMAGEEGRDVIIPLEALVSLYMGRERCSEAEKVLKNHLPAALADYPSDAWGMAVSAMNIKTNELIYNGKFACAERVLTALAAALEPETRDQRTGFIIISVYERLSYLYNEWGEDEKADTYREQSFRVKEKYGVDRYLREQDVGE